MNVAVAPIDESPKYDAAVFAALLLAFALRAFNLQGQSLFSDEIIEASIARLDLREIVTYPDGFPPLYHLILAGWTAIFRTPEAGRWLSVLTGVAAVYAVSKWAAESVSAKAGVFAAILAAISPLNIYLSQEMRAYALYICCATFAMRYFFAAVRTDRPGAWLGFVVSGALAINTHYYASLLAALLGLLLVVYRPGWSQMKRGLVAFVALGVCSLPAIALLPGDVAYQSEGFAGRAPLTATLGHTAYAFLAGYSLGPSLTELHQSPLREVAAMAALWAGALGLAALWLLVQGWRELRERPCGLGIMFLALASAPLIGLAGTLADVGPKVRYWSWIIMPLLVWLAAGAARHGAELEKWLTRLALVVLVGLQAVAGVNRYSQARYANEDTAGVAAYLVQKDEGRQPLFVVADYMAPPLRYYLNGESTLKNWLPHVDHGGSARPTAGAPADGDRWTVYPRTQEEVRGSAPFDAEAIEAWLADVRSAVGKDGRFWFVYTREYHGDRDGALLRHLQSQGWIEPERNFAGIQLFRGQTPQRE